MDQQNKYEFAYKYIYGLLECDKESMQFPLTIRSMAAFKELVDKETPKKVVVDELCWDDKACPSCKNSFLRKGKLDGCNYCPNCGQKLDWKNE